MIEEHGELTHAMLKQQQDIRQEENHIDNIEDAIGDILIYGSNFLSLLDISLTDIIIEKKNGQEVIRNNPLFYTLDVDVCLSSLIMSIGFAKEEKDINKQDVKTAYIYLFQALDCITNHYIEDKTSVKIFADVAKKVLKRDWNAHRKEFDI